MICLHCADDLAVSNSRPQKSRNQTWRRRRCKACGAVFTSIEAIDLSQAITVLKTIIRENNTATSTPFDQDRLFISLYESLRHRPAAAHDARGLTDTVVAQLIKQARANDTGQLKTRISNLAIIEVALGTLKRFDRAAATHYAAFHKSHR